MTGPLIAAGVLLGAGLGGFADGIVLHQLLQWHHMISAVVPPDTLIGIKVNMFWDGVFHAAVWLLCVGGLWCLWRAGARADVPWAGRIFGGALLCGWGLFNLVEGLVDHHLLGLHHVSDVTTVAERWDPIYLAGGLVLLIVGVILIRLDRGDARVRSTPE